MFVIKIFITFTMKNFYSLCFFWMHFPFNCASCVCVVCVKSFSRLTQPQGALRAGCCFWISTFDGDCGITCWVDTWSLVTGVSDVEKAFFDVHQCVAAFTVTLVSPFRHREGIRIWAALHNVCASFRSRGCQDRSVEIWFSSHKNLFSCLRRVVGSTRSAGRHPFPHLLRLPDPGKMVFKQLKPILLFGAQNAQTL